MGFLLAHFGSEFRSGRACLKCVVNCVSEKHCMRLQHPRSLFNSYISSISSIFGSAGCSPVMKLLAQRLKRSSRPPHHPLTPQIILRAFDRPTKNASSLPFLRAFVRRSFRP